MNKLEIENKLKDNKLPEEWVKVRLEEILKYKQPYNYIVESTKYEETGIPVLTAGKTFVLGYTNENEGIYSDIPVIIFDDFTTESKFVNFPFKVKSSAMKFLKEKNKEKVVLKYIFESMQLIKYPSIGGDHKRRWISEFQNFCIPLPTFSEQNCIISILSQIDETIGKTDSIIKKYKRIKQGLMQNLLTRGIDENGQIRSEKTHKFKDSLLGRIPKEWEVVELGKTSDIYDNLRIPLNNEDRKEMKGKYPYCGANGIIDYINKYIFDGEYVLVAEDGGYFKRLETSAYLMKGKFWVNNHAHIISAKNNIALNKFILYNLIFWDLSIYIDGTTREKLNQNRLTLIKILLPSFHEQQRITLILSPIDETIEKEQNYKEKLKRIKQGLMEDLLTGKVRVNHLIKEGVESV